MRRVAVVVLALSAVAAACQVVGGIERVSKVAPEAAVPEAAPPPPPSPPTDPCAHAVVVDRPDADDAPADPDQLPPFYVAVRTLDVVPSDDAGATRGYDLDGVCTCDRDPYTAFDGAPSCVPTDAGGDPKLACDAPGGVDNQSAKLFGLYTSTLDVNAGVDVNKNVDEGHQGLLILVSNYNGRANDKEVDLAVFASSGVKAQPQPRAGCTAVDASTQDPGSGDWSPEWCGNDRWSVDPVSAIGQKIPPVPIRTGKGWVNDFRLVVRIDEVPLPFGDTVIEINEAIFSARIVPLGVDTKPRDPSRPPADSGPAIDEQRLFRLDDGIIAGRAAIHDLLAIAGTFSVPGSGGQKKVCESNLWEVAREEVCSYLDVARTSAHDLQSGFACDALSFGAGLTAFPVAAVDTYFAPPPDTNPCRPGPDGGPVGGAPGVTYDCP